MGFDISNVPDFQRIEIYDKHTSGFLDFEWDGPSQSLFVWRGADSNAHKVYSHIKDLMNECGAACANFGKLSYCEAAKGRCAYIMLNDAVSLKQKQEIAKGMELQGYKIACKSLSD